MNDRAWQNCEVLLAAPACGMALLHCFCVCVVFLRRRAAWGAWWTSDHGQCPLMSAWDFIEFVMSNTLNICCPRLGSLVTGQSL